MGFILGWMCCFSVWFLMNRFGSTALWSLWYRQMTLPVSWCAPWWSRLITLTLWSHWWLWAELRLLTFPPALCSGVLMRNGERSSLQHSYSRVEMKLIEDSEHTHVERHTHTERVSRGTAFSGEGNTVRRSCTLGLVMTELVFFGV